MLFSCQVMSDSLWLLQHVRLPCPSLSPRVFSNSCPLSPWCYLITWPSGTLFSLCFQSFPASGSFLMNRLFTSGGQSIEASALASVFPMNIQGWFHLGLTGLIFHAVQRASKHLLKHHNSKASIRQCSAAFIVQLSHPYMTTEKNIALAIWTFVTKWYLCFLIYCLGLS